MRQKAYFLIFFAWTVFGLQTGSFAAEQVTLHANPFAVTDEDKAYVRAVKNAIRHGGKEWLADQIDWPLRAHVGRAKWVHTKKEFLKHYDEIINAYVQEAVQRQDVNDLFKSWRGIMVGKQGALWIAQLGVAGTDHGPWTYYIITINNVLDN